MIEYLADFRGEPNGISQSEDKQLGEKLLLESSGILNWLLAGCLEWQNQGLEPTPDCVLQATEEYRNESDPLSQFILDECVLHPQAQAKASNLYKSYTSWAEEQGLQKREVLSNTAFGRKITQKFKKVTRMDATYYLGVALKNGGLMVGSETTEKNNGLNSHGNSLTRDNIKNPPEPTITRKTHHQPKSNNSQPGYPGPCHVCGSEEYWMNPTGQQICCYCHPEPRERDS